MSISALTSEAARLLAYFQGAESSIESRVNAAIQALGTPGITYYVDAIAGVDTNAGTTQGAPLATLDKAISLIDNMDGRTASIYLAKGIDPNPTVYAISDQYEIRNSYVFVSSYTPAGRSVRPRVVQAEGLVNASGDMAGVWMQHASIIISVVDVETANVLPEGVANDALFRVRNFGGIGAVALRVAGIELNNARIASTDAGFLHVGIATCQVSRNGLAALINTGGVCSVSVRSTTIPSGSAWPDDLITGILRSADGAPRNVLSNLDLSV